MPSATATTVPTAVATPTPAPVPPLVIINGLVLDGRGGVIINGVVEINGDRITFVGPQALYTAPVNARVIDAGGRTVMPGVINAHVHVTESSSQSDFSGQTQRRAFLVDGVTTTCNTGHPITGMSSFNITVTASGQPAGRAFNSGPSIAAPGGYPSHDYGNSYIYSVTGVEQARAAVADLVSQGADYIKVSIESGFFPNSPQEQNLLSPAQLAAIVDEAHRLGVTVRAHVSDGDLLHLALDAGVDAIEHMPAFRDVPVELATGFQRIFDLNVPEVQSMKSMLDLMVARGVVLTPTLHMMNIEKPWTRVYNGQTVSVYNELVRYYLNAGGIIALGTDYPLNPQVGMPLLEMVALQQAGLSGPAIVRAATYNAALACGQADEIGSLEPGKLADVIVVDGNPQSSFSSLADAVVVVLGGEVVVGAGMVSN